MGQCIYCGFPAGNVGEVAFYRPTPKVGASTDLEFDVVARGFYVCDGCLGQLDYDPGHSLKGMANKVYSMLTASYGLTMAWGLAAAGSSLGSAEVLGSLVFQRLGVLIIGSALVVALLRNGIQLRSRARWRTQRAHAIHPQNTRQGWSAIKQRYYSNLVGFEPLLWGTEPMEAYDKAQREPPAIDPDGRAWSGEKPSNVRGSGVNGYYRLLWTTGQVTPLSGVEGIHGLPEAEHVQFGISEFPIVIGTLVGGATFGLTIGAGNPLVSSIAAVVLGLGAFLMARQYEGVFGRVRVPF